MQILGDQKTLPAAVGNTPLIFLKKLSQLSGCDIFGKAEFMNPGGSVKDRTALGLITDAIKKNELRPGMTIVEGSAGNTGIGLATLAPHFGLKTLIVMPNNQSQEKVQVLTALGSELKLVDPCPFANPSHFYHQARTLSEANQNYFWANQFENLANFDIHFQTTGPELFQQLDKKIDAFVSAVGTGGTLAGVSQFLKTKNPNVHIQLVDPFGSGLFNQFQNGQMQSSGSSITEGIGIMRLTANYKNAIVDSAVQVSDEEMINMLYFIAKEEGLLIGTSAALNVMAAFKLGLKHKGSGKRIATILCDSALRYQSKIFNQTFLKNKNLILNNTFIQTMSRYSIAKL